MRHGHKQLFSQHHNTIFDKEEQPKQKPYITCKNVLLTVLEGKPFQKKLLEADVPVGYTTSHYKRENKMNPLS